MGQGVGTTARPERDNVSDYVHIDQLYVSPLNVRKTPPDQTSPDFQEFLESIRAVNRVKVPLWVRPSATMKTSDSRPMYEVFDGQCRMLAARILGIQTLPVTVTLEKDDAKILQLSAFSTKRSEVTAWDWAANVQQLMEMEQDGAKRFPTHKDVAIFLCVSQARISLWLKVAQLPAQVKAQVLAGRLTHKAAERIAHGFPTAEAQVAAADAALEAGKTQQVQVAAVEVVRDEPELLHAPREERTRKVQEGTAKKRQQAAHRLLEGAPPPAAPPARISVEEREAFERLAQEHGFEEAARQGRSVPEEDRTTFERLRADLVTKVQEKNAQREPRAPNPDAVAAAFSTPRLEAPPVFATPEELALADELVTETFLCVALKPSAIARLPAEYRFPSAALAGLRQAALLLILSEWRAAGLMDTIFQHRLGAEGPNAESHATAEGRA